jgi:DHA1 family bicyclomycin/chloramphenicol resistance-like MFS transporter
MCYVCIQGFIMAGFFSYISASPFVLQNIYGLTAQEFSYCFGINGLGIMLIAQLTGFFSGRFGDRAVLKGGMAVMLAASIFVFIISLFGNSVSMWLMAAGLFLFTSCLGLTMTTSFTLAVSAQKEGAGGASGLLGVASFLFGAVMSPLVGIGGSNTAVPMGVAMVFSTAMAFVFFFKAKKYKKVKSRRA